LGKAYTYLRMTQGDTMDEIIVQGSSGQNNQAESSKMTNNNATTVSGRNSPPGRSAPSLTSLHLTRQFSDNLSTKKASQGHAGALCLILLIYGGVIALSGYEISVWVNYKNSPCEKPLTTWFAVTGIAGICSLFIGCFVDLREKEGEEKSTTKKLWNFVNQAFSLCVFIWGAAWLYAIDKNNHICPPQVYEFMFVLYIISWVLIGLAVCCGACAVLVALMGGSKN